MCLLTAQPWELRPFGWQTDGTTGTCLHNNRSERAKTHEVADDRTVYHMNVELTPDDIETLLTSLKYSKRNISEAQGTPYSVRQENLTRIDEVATKLRAARLE